MSSSTPDDYPPEQPYDRLTPRELLVIAVWCIAVAAVMYVLLAIYETLTGVTP
jgi:hypothetical protein